jgi:hypothetical protein
VEPRGRRGPPGRCIHAPVEAQAEKTPDGVAVVDRKALPAPEDAVAEDRYVAPLTPMEELLRRDLDRPGGRARRFFVLGGHSLAVIDADTFRIVDATRAGEYMGFDGTPLPPERG